MHFLPMIFRMKYIQRWSLMYNAYPENLSEHTLECAYVAHFLGFIGNELFNKDYQPDRLAALALYHDVSEIITGDLPTPIKYHNPFIKHAYQDIEDLATSKLLSMVPEPLQTAYSHYLTPTVTAEEQQILKMADTLCAYIKCQKEIGAGNREFVQAKAQIWERLQAMDHPVLSYFLTHCVAGFELSLDQLGANF